MAETALVLVEKNPHVIEFMDILRKSRTESQLKDFSALLNYVNSMEKQLNTVIGELQEVKQQINDIKDKQNPIKVACTKMVKGLQEKIGEIKERLNEIKAAIIEGSQKAVAAFKEKGLSALNSVLSFFKVKDGLESMLNSLNQSAKSAGNSIAKIEAISSEIHAIGSHTRNIGRAIVGKEQMDDVKQNGKVSKALQAPFRAMKSTFSDMSKRTEKVIAKLEQLEQTVVANKEMATTAKEKKPSILDNVKIFKPDIKAVSGDKPKTQETSL